MNWPSVGVAIAAMTMTVRAVGQVIITSDFSSSSGLSPILINTPAAQASILPSGGNPGGYADLRAVLDGNITVGGAGFLWNAPMFQLGTTLNAMVLAADYKWFSGPTLEFMPFLRQENRFYFPDTWIALGTSDAWQSVGPMTFPLSTFTHPTGPPLSPVILTHAGFIVRITSPTPIFATGRVGIDNLTLQVIPAPGVGVGLMLGLAVARRRRACEH